MRLGQISGINFISKFMSSAIGFVATLYIARHIGPEPLGIYNLAIAIVSWLAITARVGFSDALSKRISEGEDQGAYVTAGLSIIGIIYVIIALSVVLFRGHVNQYIGFQAAYYVVALLLVILIFAVVSALLQGLHLVHIYGVLSTLKTAARSGLQIILVFAGMGTAGLFVGHIVGLIPIIAIALYYIYRSLPRLSRPSRRHYTHLVEFAKYSWLGGVRGSIFNYTDIILLGIFVSPTYIGIYAVAWNISQFLLIFSSSIQTTLFPEISNLSANGQTKQVTHLFEQSLTFTGLILIPGFFGGLLLGDEILTIYGSEFRQGASVLVILIVANIFQGYQNQFLNTLNAMDRPDLGFKVNAIFIVGNVALNAVLIYIYGWVGAAVATAASALISLLLGYYYNSSIIEFEIPVSEIRKQCYAAVIMAASIYLAIKTVDSSTLLERDIVTVAVFVPLGAGIYFAILLVLSETFRDVVKRNLPFELPDLFA